MNTTSYNHAHDRAQILARRHERDMHWAKERRRQQEREAAEARALLAAHPLRLARGILWTTVALLAVVAGAWAVGLTLLSPSGGVMVDGVAAATAVAVLVGASAALGRLQARRTAARQLLRSREARLSHTQFHIQESVHSFIDARVDVVNTRSTVTA